MNRCWLLNILVPYMNMIESIDPSIANCLLLINFGFVVVVVVAVFVVVNQHRYKCLM